MAAREYQCHLCPEFFIDLKTFTDHINFHDRQESFVSNSELFLQKSSGNENTTFHCIAGGCDREFSQKERMMSHYRTVHLKAKDYNCPTCGALFGSMSTLKRHIRSVHEGHQYKCDYEDCTKSFNTSYELRTHIEVLHWGIKSYECEYEGCGKRFGVKGSLNKHVDTVHLKVKSVVCYHEGCGKEFSDKGKLARHIDNVHLGLDKSFVCQYEGCEKQYSDKGHLKRHIDTVHLGLAKSFVCQYEGCGKQYDEKRHLTRHIDTIHLALEIFVCQYEGCGKQFREKGNLKRHEAIHSEDKKYKCLYEGCSYATHERSSLMKHEKNKHLDRSYVCEYEGCGKKFGLKEHLTRHEAIHSENDGCSYATHDRSTFVKLTKSKHTIEEVIDGVCDSQLLCYEDNNYKCPFDCPYSTNRNSVLVHHIKKDHKTEAEIDRTYVCEYEGCGEKFGQQIQLIAHIDDVHLILDLSFVCEYEGCGKKFEQKENLIQHEAIHSEDEKYKCTFDDCSYATHDRSFLFKHEKNKHMACDSQLLPFFCEEEGCIERFATEEECSFHRERLH